MPRELWEPRRIPLIVPLGLIAVLTALLASGPLFEVWQRLSGEAFDCSDPGFCKQLTDVTGQLVQLGAIAFVGLAASAIVITWRAKETARWRELDDNTPDATGARLASTDRRSQGRPGTM